MPQAIGKLHQLQTLPLFVSCEEVGVSMLKNLNNLRGRLSIEHLSRVKEANLAKGANLSEKSNLRELWLCWYRHCSNLHVFAELGPHENLQLLSIVNFGGVQLPGWVSSGSALPNLVSISIRCCHHCEYIPSFSALPRLERLEIEYMDNLNRMGGYGNGVCIRKGASNSQSSLSSYSSLKKVVLQDLKNWEEWWEEDAVMFPCLEEMLIEYCPSLRKTPHVFPWMKSLNLNGVGGTGVISITSSLTSLTSLEITRCEDLEFLPAGLLSNNNQLKVMEISGCPNLQDLFPSDQEGLTDEILANSSLRESLKSIPDIRGFTSLQTLIIWNCQELETIPKGFLSSLIALEWLGVEGCSNLKFIIELSQSFKNLQRLQINECPNFRGFDLNLTTDQLVLPCCDTLEISSCDAMTSIDLRSFVSLRELDVFDCRGLRALQGIQFLTALEELTVGRFSEELDCFPLTNNDNDAAESNNLLPSLRVLFIYGWTTLQSLPHQLQHLTMLRTLVITEFTNLTELPEWLGNLSSLEYLAIWNCENLTHLPPKEQMQRLTLLKGLDVIDCRAISSIDLRSFASSLRQLEVTNCEGLRALQGLPFLTGLEELSVGGFSEELDCFPSPFSDDDDGELTSNNLPPSLRKLSIRGWPALESLPHHLQRLTTLKSLTIRNFTNLTVLPEWLGNLASLENLAIQNCENLTHLPSKKQMHRLTLLKELKIDDCPRLKERCSCRDGDGPEWPKISHIPRLWMNGVGMKH